MGGSGSGGARVGAGRKSKSKAQHALEGWAGKRITKLARRDAGNSAIEAVDPPTHLLPEHLDEWRQLAPFALANGTLTPATAGAFAELCMAIVMARELWASITAHGHLVTDVMVDDQGTERRKAKANPLLTHHRGMLVRVEAGRARFKLAPLGKAMDEPPKDEADPFDEFDEPAH